MCVCLCRMHCLVIQALSQHLVNTRVHSVVGAFRENTPFVVTRPHTMAATMGVDRWGTGGGRPPPLFSSVGPHRKCPPLVCLKSRKYQVGSSSSNLHSFVRLRNRHMLVEIASGHVPRPVPHRSTPMDA